MTSIEWLQQCLNQHLTFGQQMQFEGLFQQAKELHKQEIIDAVENGNYGNGKEYYKETFKNQQ